MTDNEVEKRLRDAPDQLHANSTLIVPEHAITAPGFILLCCDRSVVAWSIEARMRRGMVGDP